MKKFNNYIFLTLILLIFFVGAFTMFRKPKSTSVLENRKLGVFPEFSLSKYLDGTFQNDIEKAFADQFLGGEKIKKYYNISTQKISNTFNSVFNLKEKYCSNNYIILKSDRAIFNCSDYIVFAPKHAENRDDILNNINNYIKLNDYIDTYYYYVPASLVFDFRTNTYVDDFVKIFEEKLNTNERIDYLKFNNFEQFSNYFYKTDHHWNYNGSYQGYKDIFNLLKIDDEMLIPIDKYNSHERFYGSHSRMTRNYDYYDEFTIYRYKLKKFDTYINGEISKYDHIDEFIQHKYQAEKDFNYYGYVYGDDYAEVLFDFNDDGKNNLLIISNSLSNSVNEIIASHFNKTYVIDLRHYKNEFKKDFKILDYIKEKNIQKVLFIMNHNSLQQFDIGLEE